ncbi:MULTISPECIES: hypothetical protein [unclassified Amycolatopsis]|uniref:hypothetical protein n=1 Tax=unclassified Amycolatopsis TaxID=2618356 RepID=UPI002875FCBB|nr:MULTISPECIES: hypothetical protein [unclassified Amycolatopsis]MDS0135921.1 hypothetical protein [Amycolatopsis sp. 505]MDS0145490.1 hypothetical protein [Amycolatopsis sp. CM201R]
MPSFRLAHVLTGSVLSAGVAVLAVAEPAVVPVARTSAPASAVLVRLTTSPVEALGLEAYTGRYGVAESSGPGQTDNGDFSDPDGVLRRIGVATKQARTVADPARNWAQAQLTALEVKLGRKPFLKVASLDSYAECVPPPVGPWALAYNRTNGGTIEVLGHTVRPGRNGLSVTGAQLGAREIGKSTLTVVVTPMQDPSAQSRQGYARAWLDIDVTASLKDNDGKPVYDGPLTSLRLGEAEAHCEPRPPTTTPTSSKTTTRTTSSTPTSTPTSTSTSTSTSASASTSATTTGATVTPTTASSTAAGSPSPGSPGSPPTTGGLPGTGVAGLPAQAAALLVLLGAGLTLLAVARRRGDR